MEQCYPVGQRNRIRRDARWICCKLGSTGHASMDGLAVDSQAESKRWMTPRKEQVLGRVGRCIYCGRSDVALTDEHVIPLALDGLWLLKDASCEACNAITTRSLSQR
jgi:5-methylcytosine-specific restriction endonuclease McrA